MGKSFSEYVENAQMVSTRGSLKSLTSRFHWLADIRGGDRQLCSFIYVVWLVMMCLPEAASCSFSHLVIWNSKFKSFFKATSWAITFFPHLVNLVDGVAFPLLVSSKEYVINLTLGHVNLKQKVSFIVYRGYQLIERAFKGVTNSRYKPVHCSKQPVLVKLWKWCFPFLSFPSFSITALFQTSLVQSLPQTLSKWVCCHCCCQEKCCHFCFSLCHP